MIPARLKSLLAALAEPDQVQGGIRGDAIEPSRKAGSRLVILQLAVSPQKSILHDILGILLVSGHPESEAEDMPAVPLYEQPEGVAVARLRPFDSAAVVFFHPSLRLRKLHGG